MNKLKEYRQSLGITAKEAAEKAECAVITWRTWERGRNGMSPKFRKKIIDAFGFDPVDLGVEVKERGRVPKDKDVIAEVIPEVVVIKDEDLILESPPEVKAEPVVKWPVVEEKTAIEEPVDEEPVEETAEEEEKSTDLPLDKMLQQHTQIVLQYDNKHRFVWATIDRRTSAGRNVMDAVRRCIRQLGK